MTSKMSKKAPAGAVFRYDHSQSVDNLSAEAARLAAKSHGKRVWIMTKKISH